MGEYIPACRGREHEFAFETEHIGTDDDGDAIMSLTAPVECDTCLLKEHCITKALTILCGGSLDKVLDLKVTGAQTMM